MLRAPSGAVRSVVVMMLATVSSGCREAPKPPTTTPIGGTPPAAAPAASDDAFALELGCAIVEGGRVWCGSSWRFPDAVPNGHGYVPDASEVDRLWEFDGILCMGSKGQARCSVDADPLDEPLPSDAQGFVITPAGRGVRDLATDMARQCVVDGEGVPWCRWLSWDEGVEQPPLQPYPLGDIEDIELGDDALCMRSRAGEVHCAFDGGLVDIPGVDATLGDLCDADPSLPLCREPLGVRAHWPAPFRVLARSRDIAVGLSHVCLVDDRGTVGCVTTFAQPNTPQYGGTSEFVAIAGMPPILRIAASDTHVCALAEGGEVWCFGENEYGQLGDGTTTAHVETTPVLAGRWPDATAVSVGFAKSCVHRPDETLCWGWIDEAPAEGPTQVPELRASELRAFEDTTCAHTDAGWRCFGGIDDVLAGAIAAASLRTSDDPRGPSSACRLVSGVMRCERDELPPYEVHDVIDAEVNVLDVCVLRPREVWCLSPDVPDLADPPFPVPESTAIDGDAAAGCVLDGQGKPHCWRDRDHALSSPAIEARIVELAVAAEPCGLDSKGKVHCWASEPITLPLPTIVELASADGLACARDAQGGVWCWGYDRTREHPVPATAPLAMAVPASVQIVAGLDHLCSRSVAGEVHCWGDESESQRARIDPNLVLRPTKVDTFTPH